ncbi:hypothetical protein [Paenibacillus illinoisensis]|uniref:hypothetical protein n=1 Tax=Paenibacillus illinoisensis TaxID=59845 RepID=UPI001C8D5E04|nr:hypothetical protein [Paenibacillus illinoisensis]MBY0217900.1 hypothetical protein [Paenibacillus illinoisensis]
MQSLKFALQLFKDSGIPFKLSEEKHTERELKVTKLVVSKVHVLQGHVQTYLSVIENLEKKKQKGRGSLVILFEGYEHDSRRMYNVPELKAWIQKLVKNKPHLFYFIVNMNDDYVHDLALCSVTPAASFIPRSLSGYTSNSPELELNGADVTPLIQKLTKSAFIYAKKLKHTPEELMDLCMTFLDHTRYEDHLKENKRFLQEI